MTARLRIERAGPLTTIQDCGRHGLLAHGISASGAMDGASHGLAGRLAGATDPAGIEFTRAGIDLVADAGELQLGWAGGAFSASLNGEAMAWPGGCKVSAGDRLCITPGPEGNYGYLRFGGRLDLPEVMGSRSTSTRARLGGVDGRSLRAGDILHISGEGGQMRDSVPDPVAAHGPIRFVWGIHAQYFSDEVRQRFVTETFRVTPMMDRMGVRLADEGCVFVGASILSLVSDPILPGDIQILGDGTPIVLMRDHQPTGGYPRIGTVASVDLDRFAQMRPGEAVAFEPVSVDHAQQLWRSKRK